MISSRGDHFRFGLVFIKKSNQINFFIKNRNRFGLVFSGLSRFGSVFSGLDSVRFGFFGFRLIKPNRLVFSKF
jgi:hypothetical protein